MNNPNPFVPKGSLLEQQSQRRSRLKLAVFCVLAVSVTGLVAMLIQGCKRENPDAQLNLAPVTDTNMPSMTDTNLAVADTNPPVPMPPVATNLPPVPPPQPPPQVADVGGSEYVVVAGDTLAKIAKAHSVSLKALESANPGLDPKKLKIKQKLVIPASTKSADVAPATATGVADAGSEAYTVKSGDSLSKIAKKSGVSLKALEAANPGVDPAHIKVNQKLKIPAKSEAATPAPAPDTTAAPALPPMSAPAPTVPAPASGK
jgi:LysM repeat protein